MIDSSLARVSVGIISVLILSCGGGPRPPGAYRERPDDCPRSAQRAPQGTGLALSGGGYRATLFHAGALRRLNELGVLKQVDELSSVSGGSIASGQLAVFVSGIGGRLDRKIPTREWDDGYAKPLRKLTSTDIRTLPIAERLLPWNWFDTAFEVRRIADELDEHYGKRSLRDLPEYPDFVFDATDLSFGVSWEFRRWRMGSYKAGYLIPTPQHWTLGQAVASSAAFPPVIQPMPVDEPDADYQVTVMQGSRDPAKPEWDQQRVKVPDACWKPGNWAYAIERLGLSDGGVYDNLGLEPIWKDRYVLLVSNAGGPFSNQPEGGFLRRVMRWSNIIDNQTRALRKRWLIAMASQQKQGGEDGEVQRIAAYWGISASRGNYRRGDDAPGYSAELAMDFISKIRTDLNVFSEAERSVLENHGYLLADASLEMVSERHGRAALGLPEGDWPALAPPHPAWMPGAKTDCQIQKALFPKTTCQD